MVDKPKLLDEWIAAATENPILSLGKRTSIVAKIKYLLGLGVMLLLASLILWPLLYSIDQPLKLTFNALETKEAQPKTMVNPRFHGLDKFNRPFNIKADDASQQGESLVALKNISGDMAVQNNQWVMLEATEGLANTENKTLHLTGKVRLYSSEGYEINSTSVDADLNTGIATSTVPVQIQGPLGLLTGTGFVLDLNEQKLNITGRIHLTLYPQEGQHP
jgi:lipopolysaccharide export system protein LptC